MAAMRKQAVPAAVVTCGAISGKVRKVCPRKGGILRWKGALSVQGHDLVSWEVRAERLRNGHPAKRDR